MDPHRARLLAQKQESKRKRQEEAAATTAAAAAAAGPVEVQAVQAPTFVARHGEWEQYWVWSGFRVTGWKVCAGCRF